MKADPTAQARLLDLQEVDTAVAQLKHKAATLPQIEQINGAKSKWAQVSEDHVRAETEYSDAERAQQRAEADLKPVRERLTKNQERIDSGAGLDAKALRQMVDEIGHLKQRVNDLEDAQLQAMEDLESATAERDRIGTERRELHTSIKSLMEERDAALRDIQADVATLETQRATIAVDIPADLLATYDKMVARLGGKGAALLDGRRCTGCGLEANAADFGKYQAAAVDEVIRCEECGRILVRK